MFYLDAIKHLWLEVLLLMSVYFLLFYFRLPLHLEYQFSDTSGRKRNGG